MGPDDSSLGTGQALAIWRAATQRGELDAVLADVAVVTADAMPIGSLAVADIDRETGSIDMRVARMADDGRPAIMALAKTLVRADLMVLLRALEAREARRFAAGEARPSWLAELGAEIGGPVLLVDGFEQQRGACALVVASGAGFDETQRRIFGQVVRPALARAFEIQELLSEIRMLRQRLAAGEGAAPRETDADGLSDRIIGASGGLRAVMERVAIAAPSDVPVLILGETGSGKEVIARAVHAHSTRASGPFLRVNCGAIPPELVDSELFGHEKGSFTGATTLHHGWFERAHGGTLFLDEVGELPLAAQVRFLRVLQEGTLRRVGGEATVAVQVRVVAATNRDLAAMVSRGSFREDLWYRLAVFPIHLPPLREHRRDIPAMAEFFARRAAQRFDLPLRLPTEADLALLQSYRWPGNVRELGAVIDRAVLLGQGRRLEVAAALGLGSQVPGQAPPGPGTHAPPAGGSILSLDQAQKRHIEEVLRITRGQIEGNDGAARFLDINPHTLRARMRKLGIDWSRFRNTAGAPHGEPP